MPKRLSKITFSEYLWFQCNVLEFSKCWISRWTRYLKKKQVLSSRIPRMHSKRMCMPSSHCLQGAWGWRVFRIFTGKVCLFQGFYSFLVMKLHLVVHDAIDNNDKQQIPDTLFSVLELTGMEWNKISSWHHQTNSIWSSDKRTLK